MTEPRYALFDSPLGSCAIAWGRAGIVGVQLPEGSPDETQARIVRRCPGARPAPPPEGVRQAIEGITALLRGEPADLTAVALDLGGVPPFDRRVYQAARAIPPGATASYGSIASRLGAPGTARAVGRALARNPFPIIVPCHRVLASDGSLGGFSAGGGVATKLRLLAIEGADAARQGSLFDS